VSGGIPRLRWRYPAFRLRSGCERGERGLNGTDIRT
jgi:hypothetical protein